VVNLVGAGNAGQSGIRLELVNGLHGDLAAADGNGSRRWS
jgi:hypothetical protein